ncbi:MAG: hypothetical protein NXI00_11105 [Cytophagales bacterium]|nr:hypothetical protein [Cytophagales bacterium]
MTDKELIEAVVAGEINLEEHPNYKGQLANRLAQLKFQQKKLDQREAEALTHQIVSLEDLLQD